MRRAAPHGAALRRNEVREVRPAAPESARQALTGAPGRHPRRPANEDHRADHHHHSPRCNDPSPPALRGPGPGGPGGLPAHRSGPGPTGRPRGPGHLGDPDRRRPRRTGLGRGRRRPPHPRVVPRGQHGAAGGDGLPGHLRPGDPLHRLPGLGPGARAHPGAARGARRPHRRRHRGVHARHLRRPAPGVPVPGQPPGGPDGRPDERRGPVRGLVLGRHLGLGGPDHGGGFRGGGGRPVPTAPLPARRGGWRGRPELGLFGHAGLPALGAPPTPLDGQRPEPLLLRLPVPPAHRVPGRRDRAQPGARPDPHRLPGGPAAGLSRGRARIRRRGGGGGPDGDLGDHPEHDAQRHPQPGLLPGGGGRRPARGQRALRPVLPSPARRTATPTASWWRRTGART